MKKQLLILSLILFAFGCNNDKDKSHTDNSHAGHSGNAASANYCDSVNNGLIKEDTMKSSPHRTAMATINGTHVHVEYGSPGVKGRIIWGGLVGYDKVWVTGAHKATTIQFSKPVIIGETTIPKGVYALFTIPGKEEWTVIINSRYGQHLADEYDEKDDLARAMVTPKESPMVQRLTYQVNPTGDHAGEVSMQWEKLRIDLPFKTTD